MFDKTLDDIELRALAHILAQPAFPGLIGKIEGADQPRVAQTLATAAEILGKLVQADMSKPENLRALRWNLASYALHLDTWFDRARELGRQHHNLLASNVIPMEYTAEIREYEARQKQAWAEQDAKQGR
jgi:hypothetical protein